LPGGEQTVQSGASCSYGVSQRARASPAGVIRGGCLESGQPILERGYLDRANGPAASGLVQRFRQPQLGDQDTGEPRDFALRCCQICPSRPAPPYPQQKRDRHGDRDYDGGE
jgi:hypothetical protein